nr:PREDICTED: RNA-binding protein 39 [Bemisia tabaci]
MADEFDIEAMLEAPYKKGEDDITNNKPKENGISSSHKSSRKDKEKKRSRSRERHRSKSKERHRSRSREKNRSKSKDRHRSKSKDRHRSKSKDRHRSKSKDRHRSRSKDRHHGKSKHRSRSKSRDRGHKRHHSRSRSRDKSERRERRKRALTPLALPTRKDPPPRYKKSPPFAGVRAPADELSPEERDARTVFCMQLSQRIRAKDLEEFFSSVGKVRDVRLITCNKTRRFKGIAYIEFKDPESVPLAMGLTGQKLLGIPIIVQPTQAEKNRAGNTMPNLIPRSHPGPMRLYVGSLHFNITEDMLKGIFEPFGKIDSIMLMTDPETGRSKGYGFITFHNAEDAKKALEQLNGFELAGRPMKVGNVTERNDLQMGPSVLDNDELDRAGIDLGATGRLQLMYKLAEGTGMQIPPAAANALQLANNAIVGMMATTPTPAAAATAVTNPPIATQCFLLANMFDPSSETNPNWDQEIRDDVIEECNKHGGVLHVFVDKASPQGNVYVKCPTINTAVAAVNSLHGRWFAGRVITAAYVPVLNYNSLFPDTVASTQLLLPTRKGQ